MDNISKKTFHFQFHLSHTSYIFCPVPVLLCIATCFNPQRKYTTSKHCQGSDEFSEIQHNVYSSTEQLEFWYILNIFKTFGFEVITLIFLCIVQITRYKIGISTSHVQRFQDIFNSRAPVRRIVMRTAPTWQCVHFPYILVDSTDAKCSFRGGFQNFTTRFTQQRSNPMNTEKISEGSILYNFNTMMLLVSPTPMLIKDGYNKIIK